MIFFWTEWALGPVRSLLNVWKHTFFSMFQKGMFLNSEFFFLFVPYSMFKNILFFLTLKNVIFFIMTIFTDIYYIDEKSMIFIDEKSIIFIDENNRWIHRWKSSMKIIDDLHRWKLSIFHQCKSSICYRWKSLIFYRWKLLMIYIDENYRFFIDENHRFFIDVICLWK